MKKLILTMAIATMGFTATFAQDSTKRVRKQMPKMTVEQRAEKATAMFDKKLSLTADQKSKIYAIQLDRIKKVEAFRTGNKEKGKGKELAKDMQAYGGQIEAVLTPEQKTKYETIKSEMKDKMKDGKHGGMRHGGKDKKPVVSNPPSQG